MIGIWISRLEISKQQNPDPLQTIPYGGHGTVHTQAGRHPCGAWAHRVEPLRNAAVREKRQLTHAG